MTNEDRIARDMDRKSDDRKARFARIDAMAERALAVPFGTPADAITFLRCIAGHALARLTTLDSRHHAVSYFAALSRGEPPAKLARDLAWADQQWDRLTKPANDGAREG